MPTVLEPELARRIVSESSDRSFGFVFAAVFFLVGVSPMIHWGVPRWWAFGVATAFALLALMRPALLHPLNTIWLILGRLLHRIVSPLVMGVVFFLCITPIGLTMRLLGKDTLALSQRKNLPSYWIARAPLSAAADRMKKQF